MTKGILGRKIGMTQVFAENGELIPVTVIEAANQTLFFKRKRLKLMVMKQFKLVLKINVKSLSNKPEKGHAEKANTAPKRFIREFRGVNLDEYEVGQEVKVDIFAEGELVDVTGISKGKGFQGAIKRHGQSRGPMSHGSRYHRRPGSMGPVAPNRVFKGKNYQDIWVENKSLFKTLKLLKLMQNVILLLVKGNVPGPKKALVKIKTAVKAK